MVEDIGLIFYQAWVELDSRDEMDRALDLHRKHLGSRFDPFVDILITLIFLTTSIGVHLLFQVH